MCKICDKYKKPTAPTTFYSLVGKTLEGESSRESYMVNSVRIGSHVGTIFTITSTKTGVTDSYFMVKAAYSPVYMDGKASIEIRFNFIPVNSYSYIADKCLIYRGVL